MSGEPQRQEYGVAGYATSTVRKQSIASVPGTVLNGEMLVFKNKRVARSEKVEGP